MRSNGWSRVDSLNLVSGLWWVYGIGLSCKQAFLGEDCVTSSKNVYVGGYVYLLTHLTPYSLGQTELQVISSFQLKLLLTCRYLGRPRRWLAFRWLNTSGYALAYVHFDPAKRQRQASVWAHWPLPPLPSPPLPWYSLSRTCLAIKFQQFWMNITEKYCWFSESLLVFKISKKKNLSLRSA